MLVKSSETSAMGKTSSRKKDETKHADRKFEKKLEFYSKVRETVALGAQKAIKKKKKIRTRQKKLKAYNLSSLAEFLPDIESSKKETPADFKVTTKSKQKLVMKETSQLKTVLNNPAFQADPLAALHQHLQNTQPISDEKPPRKSEKGKKARKKNKKKGSALTGSQSMEE